MCGELGPPKTIMHPLSYRFLRLPAAQAGVLLAASVAGCSDPAESPSVFVPEFSGAAAPAAEETGDSAAPPSGLAGTGGGDEPASPTAGPAQEPVVEGPDGDDPEPAAPEEEIPGVAVLPSPERAESGLQQRPASPECLAVSPPTGRPEDPFPTLLSETGCMHPETSRTVVPGLIPYGVNMPLWSDSADKHRWMSIPAGESVDVREDGDWDFPVGSVLIKSFAIDGQTIETRLLMYHTDRQWRGYGYAWREDGSDAELLPSTVRRQVGDQEWTYPSRENCMECHTEAAGRSLGLTTAQLDGDFVYGSVIANQLQTLEAIGVFSEPLPSPDQREPLANLADEAASVEARARGYLDSNCSHCHRPGGIDETTFDLRHQTPLDEMRVCDVPPSRGNFGLFGARLVLPGDPEFSLLSVRMHSSISTVRMPLIGTTLVDALGVDLIDEWILGLGGCP